MVKIRLARFGRHNNPFYRIVSIDARNKRNGIFLKQLGTYEPYKGLVKLQEEKILTCLKQGAQPTETVLSILKKHGIWTK